ncbi:B12-binding domain-containing radical SAM protein [bacterium]|nr:B12-binding domain-containing radical SAM protein [bacterium]MBU3956399.1 B12-binding domain-containing radical SAM protein [bacterium]
MKVLLVKPGNRIADHIQPPLGLAYIAACLKTEHEVEILDMPKYGRNLGYFKETLHRFKPDIIGFQCYSVEASETKELVTISKNSFPSARIIIGGPHPTLCPEEVMASMGSNVDFLIRGEAERSFPLLLNNLKQPENFKTIPGLVYRESGELKINHPELIQDLDELPLPSWDLIKPQEYPPAQHGAFFKKFPIAPIITTRGCPFACTFCTAPILSGNFIRKRSAESVLSEIRVLYYNFGIKEIHIVDDNFTLDKNHAMSILKTIRSSGLPISLAVPNGVRLNTLDEELLDLMKKCGLYLISVGIESGSDKTLKRMQKALSVNLIKKKLTLIDNMGIDIAGFFIIGFPDETADDIKTTINFSLQLPLLRANYFTFLPLPKTPIYDELKAKGELNNIVSSKLLFECAPYAPRGMTHNSLRNFQREAFLKFYLRPRTLVRNLLKIKSLKHFCYLVKRFYHWVVM